MNINNAVYETEWYKSNIKFQKDLLFILMNSQKEHVFSAGGMGDINYEAFTQVFSKRN